MITERQLLCSTPSELVEITEKALRGKRLSIADGQTLFDSPHDAYIDQLASYVRYKKVGDTVSYAITLHLYPSNICCLECPICSFYAKAEGPAAFTRSVDELCTLVSECMPLGITQLHIVSGLHRKLTLEYYKDLFTRIRTISPKIEIKALSAVEYDYLSAISHRPVYEILLEMKSFGLSFLPGGGAEIFDEEIRKHIAPEKISGSRYLHIHKLAHGLGIQSNCTMLYNHIEKPIHILKHLDKIRILQDDTGGFSSFVPLRYHPHNNRFSIHHAAPSNPFPYRLYPVSRLMLDNINHICALWNYEGISQAQRLLAAGASSIGNVIYGEQVAACAGASVSHIDEKALETAITAANRQSQKQRSCKNND